MGFAKTAAITATVIAIAACAPAFRKQPLLEKPIEATATYRISISTCNNGKCAPAKEIVEKSIIVMNDPDSVRETGGKLRRQGSEDIAKFAGTSACPNEGDSVRVESRTTFISKDSRFSKMFPSSKEREAGIYVLEVPDPKSPRTVPSKDFCGQ